MFIVTTVVITITITVTVLVLLSPVTYANGNCANGCIFLGKDLGFVERELLPSYNLTRPPVSNSYNDPSATIYVSIASYRDKLCPSTLLNIFTKAQHPERVFVGVVQQNVAIDADCLETYCRLMQQHSNITIHTANSHDYSSSNCPYYDNIRMTRIDASEAKGPVWARAKGSLMMKEEEFCMQLDSHMDFVNNWETKLMQMWGLTNNEYAVLSTYVTSTDELKYNLDGQLGVNNLFEVPHLCMVTFEGLHGMVRNWGTKCMRKFPAPKLTNALWGAGLSFSKCHAERKVPYDPYLPHIFDGEEYSRALRFWTWGYDIYTPHRTYVVHNYKKSQADPVHFGWASNGLATREEETKQSVLRLKTLFDMPRFPLNPVETLKLHTSRYGLGDRRTLSQAIEFTGIDTRNRRILGNRCGNIDYIPYTEHPWGPDYIPKFNIETLAFEDVRDPGSIYFDRNSSEMMNQWIAADQQHKLSLLGKSSSSNSNSNSNNYQLRGSTAGEVVFRKVLATNFDVLKKEIVLTEHEFESELEQAMAAAFPNSKVDLPGLSKYMRSSMNNGNYTLFTVLSVVGMLILITIVFIGLCICNHNFKSSKTTSFKSL